MRWTVHASRVARHRGLAAWVAVAVLAELAACALLTTRPELRSAVPALAFHLAAALAAVAAGRARGATAAELDTVGLLAVGLPGVGPLLAWTLPHGVAATRGELDALDAHAAFDAQRARVMEPEVPPLSELVEVDSFRRVARSGDLAARSALITKLANLGGVRHVPLLAAMLDDLDEEIRIHAYTSLRGLAEPLEADLESAERAARGPASNAESGTGFGALAAAHLALARRGLLDEARSQLHLARALDAARESPRAARDGFAAARELESLLLLGRAAEALAVHQVVRPWLTVDVPLLEAHARVSFQARDWRRLAMLRRALARRDADIPEWIEAALKLTHGGRHVEHVEEVQRVG